jgi:hypothetical protein
MSKVDGSIARWENGELGLDAAHARRASAEETAAIEKAVGLQMQPISIRLEKELISALKEIAKYHGIGYQPMVRDLLHRFALSEAKEVYSKLLSETQKKESEAGDPTVPVGEFMRRTA